MSHPFTRCNDIYSLPSQHSYVSMKSLDGAFFGTTFTHLFTMTFDKIMPECSRGTVYPRVFGFKIHSSAQCMQRLRGLPSINFDAPCPLKRKKQDDNAVERENSNVHGREDCEGLFSANENVHVQQ